MSIIKADTPQLGLTNHSQIESGLDDVRLTDIKSEQVRMIYTSVPASLVINLVNGMILSAVLWDAVEHSQIFIWFSSLFALLLIRGGLYQRFKQIQDSDPIAHMWRHLVTATAALTGVIWGASAIFMFDENDAVHQIFLLLVIAGTFAGSMTTLATILAAAQSFIVLSITPIIIRLLMVNTEISLSMAVVAVLFVFMLLLSAKRWNRTIVESLKARNEHAQIQQQMLYKALYDELTELPNRRLLLSTFKKEISKSVRHKHIGAILFIDLDRFKIVNDSLGHHIGDALLVQVAKRIRLRMRKEDTIARLGGDEFVVLLPGLAQDSELASIQANKVADDFRRSFEAPFIIQEHDIHITLSIGIALFPVEATNPDELIQYADVAMYQAKNNGRDSVRLFSQKMQDDVDQRRIIEKGLRNAIINDEFELYFQAQFNSSGQIVGAETLLRWHHPEKGMLAPGYFINIAEQSGLIIPIGDWVLRCACELIAKLDSHTDLVISVNVTTHQFGSSNFVSKIEQILSETKIDPKMLRLEITESLFIENVEKTVEIMNQLKSFGLSFSVDDFGTGYSSLTYLNRLPLDELKIDQSFVRDITHSPDNAVIVETIIVMAQHLKLDIIAEGVETLEELEFLKLKNCLKYQGYYFARPNTFAHLLERLDSQPQHCDH